MRRITRITVSLIVSAVLLAAVVWWVGVEATARAVAEAGPLAFLSVGAVMAVLLACQAAAWSALNRGIGHRIGFVTLLEAATVGMAGNILTPSTYLGGEPAKVLYAGRRTHLPYGQLAGTVLLAKYLEALSFVLFVCAAAIAAGVGFRNVLFRGAYLSVGIALLALVAAGLLLSAVLWIALARRWSPLARLVGLLSRLGICRRFFAGLRARTFEMEQQVSRVFREEGRAVVPAFGLYVLTHAAMFVKPGAFFYLGWRSGLTAGELALIFLTCQVLLAFQLTPSGVGTLDGGLLAMLAVAEVAVSRPQCAAYLLCLRFWDAAVVGVGAVLAARAGAGLLGKPASSRPG